MSDMKCPFCQQELVIPKEEIRNGIQCCVCRNPKCEFDGWHFPVKLVQKLITTRKALDYTTTMLERIAVSPETMLEPEKIVPQLAGQALEQIESITKGGKDE